MNKRMKKKIDNFLRFDSIRILKLLEMVQCAILGIIFGYFIGIFIDEYLSVQYERSNYITNVYYREEFNRNPELWLHIVWDVILVTVSTYYLKKLTNLIPFVFQPFNKKYVPGLKQEGVIGFTIGLGFSYLRLLTNFQKRLDLMDGKINQ